MEKGKKRLATLVGCNYKNTRNELYGCINDVVAMREVLISRFGFDPSNIQLLTDEPGSALMPTGANIIRVLNQMIDQAEDGDVLYFHYSGHGTRVPKPGHVYQKDEAIVPCDFNLITDVDFRQLVNRLPSGASFTILSDSCHSGGLIDKEEEQIGPAHNINPTRAIHGPSHIAKATSNAHKPRSIPFESVLQHLTSIRSSHTTKTSNAHKSIPFESVLQHLSSITGIESLDIGSHLFQLFGDEASIKFRLQALENNLLGSSLRPDAGILLSGCQANETSADMNPTEPGGKAYGAFSNAVRMVLKGHTSPLSYRKVVTQARKMLHDQGFDQHPCLYCSNENADAPFLWQP